jgi:hypothetical protein
MKKQNTKAVWINFFDIVHNIEEYTENMLHAKPKQTDVPVSHTYTLVKFVS